MKKKVLFVIVGLLIIIGVVGAYIINNYNESKIYTGVATVVQSPSFTKASVEIRDNQNNIVGKSNIYSNVFWVGEQVKVEYSKKGKNYNVTKIESIVDTRQEKAKMISHIRSDVTMNSYRNMIKVFTDPSEAVVEIPALPEKIAGQYYNKTISPSEFFEIVRDIYGGIPQNEPNLDVSIQFAKSVNFKILSFETIHKDGTKEKTSYTSSGQTLKFKQETETGRVYSLRVEFESEDIINYVFWMDETQH